MQWEYRIIHWSYESKTRTQHWLAHNGEPVKDLEGLDEQDALNALGQVGWELMDRSEGDRYYFKRPK